MPRASECDAGAVDNPSRRLFLTRGVAAAGAAVAAGTGAVALMRWGFGQADKAVAEADLASYPATVWGKGTLALEDLGKLSCDDLKHKIENPQMAAQWVRLLSQYNREALDSFVERVTDRGLADIAPRDAVIAFSSVGGFSRKFQDWHEYMRRYARYRKLADEFSLSQRDGLNLNRLLASQGSQASELPRILENEKRKLHAALILRSDLTDLEKLKELTCKSKDRRYFPYTLTMPTIPGQTAKLDELRRAYFFGSTDQQGKPAVCEDVTLSVMELLRDDGYPPLGLCMQGKMGNHIVYLVKGEQGFGCIGYNPNPQICHPKYKTVRELMQKEFPEFERCAVIDYERSGFLGDSQDNAGQTTTHSFAARIKQVMKPVVDYLQ